MFVLKRSQHSLRLFLGDVDALTDGVKRLSALEGEADDLKANCVISYREGFFFG